MTLAELIRKYYINISPERLSGCLRSTNMKVVVNPRCRLGTNIYLAAPQYRTADSRYFIYRFYL